MTRFENVSQLELQAPVAIILVYGYSSMLFRHFAPSGENSFSHLYKYKIGSQLI